MVVYPSINPNPVLSVTTDGTLIYANKASEPILYAWDVFIGEKLPFDLADFIQMLFDQNRIDKLEMKIDNQIYVVDFYPVLAQQCINIYGFDVTDQKELEEKLRISEKKSRILIETASEGVWIFGADSKTTYVNQKMADMLDCATDEMIGRFIWDFAGEEDKGIFQVKLANRKKGIDEVYEFRLLRKNGTCLWVLVSAKAIFSENGDFEGSLGMFTDITERKQAETALRKAHDDLEMKIKERTTELEDAYELSKINAAEIKMLAYIVESSNDSILSSSTEPLDGIITSWNKASEQVFGYSASEIMGKHISILEPDNYEGEMTRFRDRVKQGKTVEHFETKRKRKDGTIIDVSVTLSPILDVFGKQAAISAIVRDISERKKAEAALAYIEIARKKEIHHRIKNNLQVISSLLDLQADQFTNKINITNADVAAAFKETQDRVISMALIHEELHKGGSLEELNFSRYLEKLAENLVDTYQVARGKVALKMNVKENIFFNVDVAVPLGIIVNELVSNSFKHAFKGRDSGELTIELTEYSAGDDTKCCVLTVSDNGVGIPKNLNLEDLDSLGMQLVFSLVDQLGGKLAMKKNGGVKFIMTFDVCSK